MLAAKMSLRPALALLVAVTVCATGCPNKGNVASKIAKAPDLTTETGQAKCGVKASAAKPLVVEWPAADRAALEARATRGLIAVRYEGCDMEVMTNCIGTGQYNYLSLTPKHEGVRITNADELYANLPVGAVKLEGKLKRDGQLNVDMVIIGRKEADKFDFTERDFEGRCSEATHVVTGITVGAFSFYTGASADVGAGVQVGNIAGAGASSGHQREVINEDGSQAACDGADPALGAPPQGCGALLRVEVVPIDRIFSAPTNNTTGVAPTGDGGTTTTTSTPTDNNTTTVTADPEADKKIKTWRTIGLTSYGLALGTSVAAYVGIFFLAKSKNVAMTDPGMEREQAIQRHKMGIGLIAGGFGAALAFLALGLASNAKVKKLQAGRRAKVQVGPAFVNRGGGVSFGVNF
jgi:hypothetical protein